LSTLSLAMIVRNEGATIERALNCATPFADEMVVVDTGSTDDTVAKAEAMGAKVSHFGWITISPRRAITRFRNAQWTGSSGSTATT
jgi:glycosyltransferase involved in cell wall biosynthesis